VTGVGAARLENISYAGRIGRLYNLLRRNVADDPNPAIDTATVRRICQLNNIDRPSREMGLKVLAAAGRIDVAGNEAVTVLGATSRGVLEVTADIFADSNPTTDEEAVLELSEKVAEKPVARKDATEFVGDLYKLPSTRACSLIDLCKSTAIIDEETDRDRTILFNSNTFRDGQYAIIDVHLPTTDGRELVLTRYTEPEPELSLLLKKLKLELPAQPPPKITAALASPIPL
jgi:hypothetical protein